MIRRITASALAEWNAAVQRAREDYERAPNRACDWSDECPAMTHDYEPICKTHRSWITRWIRGCE